MLQCYEQNNHNAEVVSEILSEFCNDGEDDHIDCSPRQSDDFKLNASVEMVTRQITPHC